MARDDSGVLCLIDILHNGMAPCDSFGVPLEETGETVNILGWGELDGVRSVWQNDVGGEDVIY